MKIYMVGGAVRDRLLGLPVKDRDWVVVGATPEEMEAAGYRPVGKDFPVFLHPQTHEEYALARTERKAGRGYKGFVVHAAPDVTLEDDLMRRDLTINAMAEDEAGALIDPHGGRNDLKAGILRHVSAAFVEDPLRVLRVARFAARLNFQVAAGTLAMMTALAAGGELNDLTAERVWQELERALTEPYPRRFIEVLRECGALAVLFPEIDRLFGVPQRADYHPEIDTGIHTLMVLEQAAALSPDPRVRFAALMHDLGKGTTPGEILPRHFGHEERSVELLDGLCNRYRIPNDYRELACIVARHHGQCHRVAEMRGSGILRLLQATDAFRRPERFRQFLLACEADARGRLGLERRDYPSRPFLEEALRAASAVDTAPLIGRGLQGEVFAAELHRLRVNALDAMRKASLPAAG